jgi:putative ABC transport system ATP-binding protein
MSTTPSPRTAQAATAAEAAVSATDVAKTYGSPPNEVRALDGVSATFPSGGFTAIMGPSGSGKSTFLHVLSGLDRPTAGTVRIGGVDVTDLDDRALSRLRRTEVGFVFQSFNLVPSLSASENITLPLRLDGRRPDPDWFEQVVDTVGLADRLHHRPSELSGGQQQRVAVARALLSRPAVVFADEPTGNLDSNAGAEVLSFLRRVARDHGQTIVMVTHDPHAAAYADRVLYLRDGRVVDDSTDVSVTTVLDRLRTLGGR